MVDGTCLENRPPARVRRFESCPLRSLRVTCMEPSGTAANPPGLNDAKNEHCSIASDMQLAEQLIEVGDAPQAVKIYDSILLNSPAHLPTLKARIVALTIASRYESALLDARKVVELNPDDCEASWIIAGLLRRVYGEQGDEVLQAYDAAYKVDPLNPYLRIERADILRSHNRHTEAIDEYVQVAESADHEEILLEARYKEGCVAMVLGFTEQARAAFSTVLEISPSYEEAEIMYQLLN